MKRVLQYSEAIVLAAFGLLTLYLSSSVIFDLFDVRTKEGHYILFVVWANFVSSLLYLLAAWGFSKNKQWTALPLGISAIILSAAFLGLLFYINAGGIYEVKTIGAMIFRITLTLVFTVLAYFSRSNSERSAPMMV
jgi:hypothetical protein